MKKTKDIPGITGFIYECFVLCLFALLSGYSVTSVAQQQEPATIGDTDIRPVSFSGRLSLLSEAYAVNGIDARKPPGMGQINFSSTFSLFGLRSGINILYSTNDNQLRQSTNQFNFYGSWRWLTLSAGTVSPRFSRYSLSGVAVSGGLIDINPGVFSLTLAGGKTRRPVAFSTDKAFRESSFEQWLYAARMGFGKRERTEFAISGVYAYDVVGSLEAPLDIFPSENLNITPEFNLSLFKGKFRAGTNFTVSAFTRDRTGEALEVEEIPSALTDFFAPNSSTRIDYAGEVTTQLDLGVFKLNGAWERVQPGFRSLGLAQLRSDSELLRFRSQLRLAKGKINISGMYSQGRNNLLNTRTTELSRQQGGANVMIRLARSANLLISYMRLGNENRATSLFGPNGDELHQYQISQNIMVTPTWFFASPSLSHSVSLNGSWQELQDKSRMVITGQRPAMGFRSITTGAAYGISFPGGLSVNLSGNYLHNEATQSMSSGYSFNSATGYAFFDKKLMMNLALGWSRNGSEYTRILDDHELTTFIRAYEKFNRLKNNGDDFLEGEYVVRQWSQQYSLNLSASYRLPNRNSLSLSVRGIASRPGEGDGRQYNEFNAMLRYDHRF